MKYTQIHIIAGISSHCSIGLLGSFAANPQNRIKNYNCIYQCTLFQTCEIWHLHDCKALYQGFFCSTTYYHQSLANISTYFRMLTMLTPIVSNEVKLFNQCTLGPYYYYHTLFPFFNHYPLLVKHPYALLSYT